MPQFIKVAPTDELADQLAKLGEVEGQKIALFRVDGGTYALSDTYPWKGADALGESALLGTREDQHGTTIGFQEAPDPDFFRSGREGW